MTAEVLPAIPTRFRAAPERSAKIGRMLKSIARVDELDEDLMQLIGRRFMEKDELGAALVQAIRVDKTVTMAQFNHALHHGVHTLADAPAALRAFFDHVEQVPSWVDMDLVNEGARIYRTYGQNSADVLLQLSLIGGYRFGGPTDLLVATGGLVGDMAKRRLAETQKWGIAISEHNSMLRDGEGFKLTVHVRLMHAMVNYQFERNGKWDIATWGLPINQTDQASTLGLFNGTLLLGVRALGVRVTRRDSRAIMHLWKYVGWLMGVNEDWLFDTEREQHRLNYHVLMAQAGVTEAGAQLANAIVDAQRDLHVAPFGRLRTWLIQERLLSMLRVFLGKQGLADLKLPVRPPWALVLLLPKNLILYRVLGRTSFGQELFQARSRRTRDRIQGRYFGKEQPEVAKLHG